MIYIYALCRPVYISSLYLNSIEYGCCTITYAKTLFFKGMKLKMAICIYIETLGRTMVFTASSYKVFSRSFRLSHFMCADLWVMSSCLVTSLNHIAYRSGFYHKCEILCCFCLTLVFLCESSMQYRWSRQKIEMVTECRYILGSIK